MMIKKCKLLFFSAFLLLALSSCGGCGCGCGSMGSGYKIGVDPDFLNNDFKGKDPYVLGFAEDVLIEISKNERINFEVITANWNSMLDDLKREKYDGILSSLPPYNFNDAQFDFSESLLEIGPVLVISKKEKSKSFKSMDGKLIGYLEGDMAFASIIEKHPGVIMRTYPSAADLFRALNQTEIDALMIDRLQAVSFINEFYMDSMKIIDKSMSEQALRLVVKHDKNYSLLYTFDKGLARLKKKSKYKELMQKWKLKVSP